MKRQKLSRTLFVSFCAVICGCLTACVYQTLAEGADDKVTQEIVLQVEPNIIAVPENEAVVIPVAAAKVRSTDLRKLNEEYNAVSVEKVFELVDEGKETPLKLKGLKGKAKAEEVKKAPVDVSKVFTKRMKKKFLEEGKKVSQVPDVFILTFKLKKEISLNELLNAYKALSVVVYADSITRSEADEKK